MFCGLQLQKVILVSYRTEGDMLPFCTKRNATALKHYCTHQKRVAAVNCSDFLMAINFAGTSSLQILQLDNSCVLLGRESSSVLRRLSSYLWKTPFHQQVWKVNAETTCSSDSDFASYKNWWYSGTRSSFSLDFTCLLVPVQLLWCLQSMKRTRMRMDSSTWPTVVRTPSGSSRWLTTIGSALPLLPYWCPASCK